MWFVWCVILVHFGLHEAFVVNKNENLSDFLLSTFWEHRQNHSGFATRIVVEHGITFLSDFSPTDTHFNWALVPFEVWNWEEGWKLEFRGGSQSWLSPMRLAFATRLKPNITCHFLYLTMWKVFVLKPKSLCVRKRWQEPLFHFCYISTFDLKLFVTSHISVVWMVI